MCGFLFKTNYCEILPYKKGIKTPFVLCFTCHAIIFVAIPFAHLLNDEMTKGIISEESWYQGLRYMLGIYVEPTKERINSRDNAVPRNTVKPVPSV